MKQMNNQEREIRAYKNHIPFSPEYMYCHLKMSILRRKKERSSCGGIPYHTKSSH